MIDLMVWLRQQGLSVRELAAGLELPVRTVENWVYEGVMPSAANRVSLEDFMCTHYWIIDAADGHSVVECASCATQHESSRIP